MGALKIPKEGIALLGGPCSVPAKTDAPQLKPLQAMRLELEEGILENILRSARSGGKGVHLSFGKTIVSECLKSSLSTLVLTFYIDSRLRKSV